jgi:hypothetical protein
VKDRLYPKNMFRRPIELAAYLPQPRSCTLKRLISPVGTWLSLVEHSLGVRGVGSSNLPVPTKPSNPNYLLSVCSFVAAALATHPARL